MDISLWEIVLRLFCAMVIGAVVGFEREFTHKPVGIRTHMLVAVASCGVMITGQMIFAEYSAYGATPDPTRLSAQIISGIGFLGAGTIMREGSSIKGLTTAASIWAVACLSISVGAGYYKVGLIGLLCMIVILTLFDWLQKRFFHSRVQSCQISVICADSTALPTVLQALSTYEEINLQTLQCSTDAEAQVTVTVQAEFSGSGRQKRLNELCLKLQQSPCIQSVRFSCT